MHKHSVTRLSLTPLLLAMALPASLPVLASESSSFALEEVIVTARRKDESLQDVPEAVSAVTGDSLKKLSLLNFEDMTAIVPGMNLDASTNGYGTSASMRGASFDANSSASPTVQMYINEAPVHANQMYIAMYDIGQIEVLKGPQGTMRGVSSPSGAITLTTHAPVMDEMGGYINLTETNKEGSNYQAAVNIPIIEGKLAARVAGLVAQDLANHVTSVNSSVPPKSDTDSYRASLRWTPTDDIDIQLMHQKTDRDRRAFIPVVGDGIDLSRITGKNGPRIEPKDRLAVGENPGDMTNDLEANTLNMNWTVFGHEISYVGSRSKTEISGLEPRDLGDLLPGDITTKHNLLENNYKSHEIRIASEEPYADLVDYNVGLYTSTFWGGNDILYYGVQPVTTAYSDKEDAFFANLTFYLTEDTDLSVGARHIKNKSHKFYNFGSISTYDFEESTNVYKASLSHSFNEELLGYVSWGTSFRMGPAVVGLRSSDITNPQYGALTVLQPEESSGWELGLKADFMDGKARVNAAVFSQKFDNYIYRGAPVLYAYDPTFTGATPSSLASFNFTTGADATVEGIEIDSSYQATENWVVSAAVSWYDSKLDSPIPCNTALTANNTPSGLNAAGLIVDYCDQGGSITLDPDWSATLQSEYTLSLTDALDGYVRGLYSYYAENDNKHQNRSLDAYGLLNLYVGVRDEGSGWEVQLFAKNLLNEGTTTKWEDTEIEPSLANIFGGSSGYVESDYTPPREVGLNVQYNF